MRQPGVIGPGEEPSGLISSIDLMPTLLALCDIPTPEACAGIDLSGAVAAGAESPSVESIYCEGKLYSGPGAGPGRNSPVNGPWRSIVTERYKLTVRNDPTAVESLYDLREDPLELRNMASDASNARLVGELAAELRQWSARTGDSFPAKPDSALESYEPAQA